MGISVAKDSILAIAPYVGGTSKLAGKQDVIKLSSNENPFGPSPLAVKAMLEAVRNAHLYPDGGSVELRAAIGAAHGLDAARIVCGAGSDELISFLCQAFTAPGDEVLYSQHGFLMYPIYARVAGAVPVTAPEEDLKASVENLLAAVTPKTRLVFIANPNNPTGSYLTRQELAALRKGLRPDILLVVDMAYAEYASVLKDYPEVVDLVDASDNVVMLRTFSKIYGLATLRLGWAYAPENIVDILNRVRGPFNVSGIAQAAGVAALRDTGYVEQAREHNAKELKKVTSAFADLGLYCYPSAGNFVLVQLTDEPGRDSTAADARLKNDGIIVRRMESYGLPSCLRITIGTKSQNEAVIKSLTGFSKK